MLLTMIKIESYPSFTDLKGLPSFIALGLIMVGLFLLTQLAGTNLSTFHAINTHAHQIFSDGFWVHITDFGNGSLAGVLALATVVLYPQLSKRLLITILLTMIAAKFGKEFFDAVRPPGILSADQFHLVGNAITKHSFPSGHTATAFVLAGYIWLSFSNAWLRGSVLALAILVALSRTALGVHWPEDITSGAVLGWVVAWIAAMLSRSDFSRWGNYAAGIFLAFAAIVGTVTGPVEFELFPSLQKVRWLFAGVAALLGLYFFARLLMLKPKIDVWARSRIIWVVSVQNWLPVRFSKFALVGFTGFLIDSLVYLVVQSVGVPHLAARAVSYWVSATCNWYLNRMFTFNDSEKENKLTQWIKYLSMCLGSFVLNWGSYYVLTQYVEFFIEYKFVAFIIGIAMGMVFNFTVAHLIIFKNKNAVS